MVHQHFVLLVQSTDALCPRSILTDSQVFAEHQNAFSLLIAHEKIKMTENAFNNNKLFFSVYKKHMLVT